MLQQILSQMTIQLFGKEAPLKDLMFLEVAEKSFIHGGCILGNKVSNDLLRGRSGGPARGYAFVYSERDQTDPLRARLCIMATPSLN